jgi:hypothetical protein
VFAVVPPLEVQAKRYVVVKLNGLTLAPLELPKPEWLYFSKGEKNKPDEGIKGATIAELRFAVPGVAYLLNAVSFVQVRTEVGAAVEPPLTCPRQSQLRPVDSVMRAPEVPSVLLKRGRCVPDLVAVALAQTKIQFVM